MKYVVEQYHGKTDATSFITAHEFDDLPSATKYFSDGRRIRCVIIQRDSNNSVKVLDRKGECF